VRAAAIVFCEFKNRKDGHDPLMLTEDVAFHVQSLKCTRAAAFV
jgi:hypothetical protein